MSDRAVGGLNTNSRTGPIRVAVIADFIEEGWPSMDLVAEALAVRLAANHGSELTVDLMRPPLRRRFTSSITATRIWSIAFLRSGRSSPVMTWRRSVASSSRSGLRAR
jgi:hypothetical protein